MSDTSTWLIDLFEEQGATMHRLAVMLGAESESGHILRTSMLGLAKRSNRIVDPAARVEYLAEQVVHQARSARGQGHSLDLPEVADPRQEQIRRAVAALPTRLGEILVVSHYLSVFGPELAGVMRMTVRGCNQRLEEALDALRRAVGEPGPVSLPGVIESLSQELTAALRSSARLVQAPGTEMLEAELRSLKGAWVPRVPLLLVVVMVLLSLLLTIWLWGSLPAGRTQRTDVLPTATTTSQSVAPLSRALPSQVQGVPVYYVGRQDGKLHREFRNLAVSGDLASTVVNAILTVAPLDPDYSSGWNPGRVLGVSLEGSSLTINLSPDAFPSDESGEAVLQAIDQVVHAVTEVLGNPNLEVHFTSNGDSPPEAFRGGHRDRGQETLAKLWVDTPGNGSTVSAGTVVFSGVAQQGTGQPRVLVTDASETLLTSQYAQTEIDTDAAGWHGWSVSLSLDPGDYLVRVETTWTDEAGNSQVSQESRTITVQ
ncbi:MAG: GerMN domain-containing protein [Propionibacterium sp.]|nr:GerMN domain-containing protein [Propionibacterium sp.]